MLRALLLTLSFLLVPATSLAAGPTEEELAARPPYALSSYPAQTLGISSRIRTAIEHEIKEGRQLQSLGSWERDTQVADFTKRFPAANLPKGIYGAQRTDLYRLGEVLLQFIAQPIQSTGIWSELPPNATVTFAGILASTNEGKSWETFVRLPVDPTYSNDCPRRFIPIALFLDGETLLLDLRNDCGGGSGEGEFIRFRSADFGKTWEWAACFYFMPEMYYPRTSTANLLDQPRTWRLHRLRRWNERSAPVPGYPYVDCDFGDFPGAWTDE